MFFCFSEMPLHGSDQILVGIEERRIANIGVTSLSPGKKTCGGQELWDLANMRNNTSIAEQKLRRFIELNNLPTEIHSVKKS